MIAYTDIGKGKTIVFIHGLGSRKEAWKPQHKLAKKFRLIIPDLRGHGETKLETDISMKNFAKDIIDLLKHLKIKSAYICGLSLGGLVAQEIYKQNPKMVKGLILSNTTSLIPSFFAEEVIINSQKVLEEGKKEELINAIADKCIYNKKYIKEARNAFLIRDCYIDCVKAPLDINYFPMLMTLYKPTLIIGSTFDKVTPSVNQYAMYLSTFGKANYKIIESGHLSNIEQSEQFNNYILDFIQEDK